jgi:hypothetical protein
MLAADRKFLQHDVEVRALAIMDKELRCVARWCHLRRLLPYPLLMPGAAAT